MKITEQTKYTENGLSYIKTVYDKGTIDIHVVSDVQPEPAEELTPEPSNAELQELLLSIMEGLADMYTAESGEAVE